MRHKLSIILLILSFLINDLAIAGIKTANTPSLPPLQTFSTLRSAILALFPNENIVVKMANHTIILTGIASTPEIADKIEKLAKEYSSNKSLLNFMKIKTSQQVLLKVKIAEVERKNVVNINLNSSDNLDILVQRGLVKLLAEPNLVSLSGEEAQFESGSSFPIGKDKDNNVEYKSYGVKIKFTPVILSSNRIRLNVEPTLSNISEDTLHHHFPKIDERKAKTSVELAPGESFMIAGLIQDFYHNKKRDSKELIIAVTPYLVDPIHNKNLRAPTDNLYLQNDLEKKFIRNLAQEKKIDLKKNVLNGPVGYMVD